MNDHIFKDITLAFIFGGIFVVVPVIHALLRHQREMTALINQNHSSDVSQEIALLRAQVTELRDRQNMMMIAASSEDSRRIEVGRCP